MTMQKNRPLVAIPNVLSNETLPNRLRGMGMAHAPTVSTTRRTAPPVALVAALIGAAIAVAVVVMSQGS
jgi:hypothetical protein